MLLEAETLAFHLLANMHFVTVQKHFCNMPCKFVPFCCVYVSTLLVFLFMKACLEKAVPSQSA